MAVNDQRNYDIFQWNLRQSAQYLKDSRTKGYKKNYSTDGGKKEGRNNSVDRN